MRSLFPFLGPSIPIPPPQPGGGACPISLPGWIKLDGGVDVHFPAPPQTNSRKRRITWHEAEAKALEKDAILAVIRNKKTASQINRIIKSCYAKDVQFWIGANDLADVGEFAWTTGEQVGFTDWAPDQPDNTDGRCITLSFSKAAGNWKWRTAQCNARRKNRTFLAVREKGMIRKKNILESFHNHPIDTILVPPPPPPTGGHGQDKTTPIPPSPPTTTTRTTQPTKVSSTAKNGATTNNNNNNGRRTTPSIVLPAPTPVK